MLTRAELAAMQGVHRATITKWREKGRLKGHLADDREHYTFLTEKIRENKRKSGNAS
jgi:predicted site-specific integrase-resolvase